MKTAPNHATPPQPIEAPAPRPLPALPSSLDWDALCERFLPDLEERACELGLIQRVQSFLCARDIVRLLLAYVTGDVSFRSLALWAAVVLGLDVTDEAIRVKCLRALPLVEQLVRTLLARLAPAPFDNGQGSVSVRLIDATMLSGPGSAGIDWRLHVTYDLARRGTVGLELTDDKQAEGLARCAAGRFDIPIGDRAYGLAKHYHHGFDQGQYPLLRVQLTNLRLTDEAANVLPVRALLERARQGEDDMAVLVPLGKESRAARLVWGQLPPEQAGRARQTLRKNSSKKGHTPSDEALELAGYVVLLTRLPREAFSVAVLRKLYRQRWQIELYFKRCRQLLGLWPAKKLGGKMSRVMAWTKMLLAALLEAQQPTRALADVEPGQPPVSLWRLTHVLMLSMTATVFAALTDGWEKWVAKLAERRRRKRKYACWELASLQEVLARWQDELSQQTEA